MSAWIIQRTRTIEGGFAQIRYWNGKRFVHGSTTEPAKFYTSQGRASLQLARLIKKCEAFADETKVVEYA
ncbi:hypothetical protein ACW910_24295 (plasmid) [Burkholderia ambifaria]